MQLIVLWLNTNFFLATLKSSLKRILKTVENCRGFLIKIQST